MNKGNKRNKKNWFNRNWKSLLFWFILLLILFFAFFFKFELSTFLLSLFPIASGDNATNDGGSSGVPTDYSCIDSDDGLSYYMVGNVIDQDGIRYNDNCESNVLLKEYYCSNDRVATRNFACPLGYECFQTRSGGYCNPLPTHNDGDVLNTDSDSGSTLDVDSSWNIDMSSIGSGNCNLGGTFEHSWTYGNQDCGGVQASEGVKWSFYDSNGLVYTTTETSPTSLGMDLGCGLDYDGVTPFKVEMEKLYGLPDCQIDYSWNLRIIACECS